jgi:outer membrane protein
MMMNVRQWMTIISSVSCGAMAMLDCAASVLPAPAQVARIQHSQRFNKLVQENWIPPALESLSADAIYNQSYDPNSFSLPEPAKTHIPVKLLTLHNAILLALRYNPDIKSSELQRVVDKFDVVEAKNQFEPQFTLGLNTTYTPKSKNATYAFAPGVKVTSPFGTSVSVNAASALNGSATTTDVTVTQPLLRGFGMPDIGYKNALISEKIDQLNFKQKISDSVEAVVEAYRNLVSNYNQLKISQHAIVSQEKLLSQFKLKLKVGKASRSDVYQQESTLETTRLSYVEKTNTVTEAYQNLLSVIGLTPMAKVEIDKSINMKNTQVPSLKKSIALALENHLDYQSALLTLQITKNGLVQAKDASRWGLDLTLNKNFVNFRQNKAGESGGNESAALDLSIPIDDVSAQGQLLSAKIAMEQAKISLANTKQNLIKTIYSQWQTIKNEKQQLAIQSRQVQLQKQTLDDAKIKQRYGRATVFEFTQIQDQLLSSETEYISGQIGYLNNVSELDNALGITLKKWNIKLRY